ncbi:hypothetical protein TWF730_003646 [Orbilia blumenaviensis]|uniref:CENP-V/GFA domain-containing protein n=1 Tax=Orbilia blumenaviensis TaxID=1796055 RepID=A0AAV9U2Z6_9PEZI
MLRKERPSASQLSSCHKTRPFDPETDTTEIDETMPQLDLDSLVDDIRVACHCGANTYSFLVSTPLKRKYTQIKVCQCTNCRLQTGNLAGWYIQAPQRPFEPETPPASLTAYAVEDGLTHYFCNKCSSKLFRREENASQPEQEFWLFTGCVTIPTKARFQIGFICCVDRESDGGLAAWLPNVEYRDTKDAIITTEDMQNMESRLDPPIGQESEGSEERQVTEEINDRERNRHSNANQITDGSQVAFSDNGEDGDSDECREPSSAPRNSVDSLGSEANWCGEDYAGRLMGRCHCMKVRLRLSRQKGAIEEREPYTIAGDTDLVIPYWSREHIRPTPSMDLTPWWTRESHPYYEGKRFLGGHCTCNSCRTIAGTEIQSWIFVPTRCIEILLPDGDVISWPTRQELSRGLDERLLDIIGFYDSTPANPAEGVHECTRGFCKKCGANIFWDSSERWNLVDLSAGLFSARGFKEQRWIEWWTNRVSYKEDPEGTPRQDIAILLEKGLKEWDERQY